MKSPRSVAFVAQTNIAGVQQVNNTPAVDRPDPSRSLAENARSKLLEGHDEQRLDARTTQASVQADPRMEAVASINRAKIA